PSLALSLLLALSLAMAAAGATAAKKWLVPFVGGLLSWVATNAIQSFWDPRAGSVRVKLALLAGLSLLIPCLAVAIPATNWLFPDSSRLVSMPANVFLLFVALPYVALIGSVRNELPHKLTVVLAAAVAKGGVSATGWLLHKDSLENPSESGIIGAVIVLALSLIALCIGLYGGRETLNLRCLLSLCSLLFIGCVAATIATQFAIDHTSELRLQALQPISVVATVAAAFPLLTSAFASHERHALNIGHSTRAARTIAVCRILVKIFALCSLFFSASFGFSFDSPSFWCLLNFIALMASIVAMNGALGYVRFKDPPLRGHPMDCRSVLLSILMVAIVAGEISLVVLCHLSWTPVVPSSAPISSLLSSSDSSLPSTTTSPLPSTTTPPLLSNTTSFPTSAPFPSTTTSPPSLASLSFAALSSLLFALPIGVLCLAAHCAHLVIAVILNRLRTVLRPFSLYPGLVLLGVSNSLIIYGELTQMFPGQSGSPTVWLAASLAAAAAMQLIAIPAVECLKSEAAMKKRKRKELSAAFRADAKQRLLQKRSEKALQKGAISPAALPSSAHRRSNNDEDIEMVVV
ncbi:hypothetical protein PMAYCL1PPCAC_08287, partial [Pristionchus mayeri]